MIHRKSLILLSVAMLIATFFTRAQVAKTTTVAFSAIKGSSSKPVQVVLPAKTAMSGIRITGDDKERFKVVSLKTSPSGAKLASITFTPAADVTGITHAKLQAGSAIVNLNGVSTKGLEGENEASLSAIIEVLGYKIAPGWKTLANTVKPELQGDEISAQLFKKAGPGKVQMIPVARYSPDFELAFGYYTIADHEPKHNESGILSKSGAYIEHQALNPALSSGATSFEPGTPAFGFYVKSTTHTAYSEDVWNMALYPDNAVRAVRTYPVKNSLGKPEPNTYLVCFEEAMNGDYNDFVFLVKNVKPVTADPFTTLFNGKDLSGFHSYLQKYGANKDPNNNFRVENGELHVIGKDLGYVITDKSYSDFHLKVDFKWGTDKWPPRQNAKRDAGICYNIPASEPDSIWPVSIECQIQEGDTGDFWMLGFSTLEVNGKVNRPTNHIQAVKRKDNERPTGQWNTVEVISYKGRCINIVNGEIVNFGQKASVRNGKFLLQSEYSEVYYKDIKIREL